jgi:putative transposase
LKFSFIAKHRGVWQTRRICEALGVSRGGFYEWMSRPEAPRTKANRQLIVHIRTSFEQSDRTYVCSEICAPGDTSVGGIG